MSIYPQLRAVWAELTAPGAPFEIAEFDIRGIRLKGYAAAPNSLRDVWLTSTQFAERDYLVYEDERLTYAQAHARVASIANWLIEHNVQPGDVVAIAMRNYPEWLQAYWAAISIGATVSGMNAWWVGPEMVHGINEAAPKILICDEQRLQRLTPHRQELACNPTLVGVRLESPHSDVVGWSELLTRDESLPNVSIDTDSVACIFYTSGTTGFPKGAQLTHRGCLNNIMNLSFWGTCLTTIAEQNGSAATPPAQLASLITTPLFHVTANNCVNHPLTLQGGKLVHMYKWDAGEALKLIEAECITSVTGVPVMARELLAHPDFDRYDTSSVAGLGGGGAQLPPDLVGKIAQKASPGTGYGMTETCGVITSIGGNFFLDKPTSAGPVLPNYDAMLVDEEGLEVPVGSPGELWVKGAPVIRGYLNRPEATAETITDGWLHTGDIARMDEDGFLYIVDRAKDMVLRGGENVYCAEVEAALYDHDAVAECSVFSVPDDRLGEEVGAAIFCKQGKSVDANGLREHCAMQIAKHKIPRYIWVLDEPLPRNANGKFLKRELREQLEVAAAR
ncbi:MAG: AMP-dependent synthetase [Gammaproteobacteria bacterium]|nr:AMP-dependent synthetase [Gammaproteobacteria bacterium]|tara:strand:+ start:1958 stop:3643 length:1686 start_codon:yes stop_codon:yes gene_type:complete